VCEKATDQPHSMSHESCDMTPDGVPALQRRSDAHKTELFAADMQQLQAKLTETAHEALRASDAEHKQVENVHNSMNTLAALAPLDATVADVLGKYLDEMKGLKEVIADKEHDLADLSRQRHSLQVNMLYPGRVHKHA
jgi:hypothetical protein